MTTAINKAATDLTRRCQQLQSALSRYGASQLIFSKATDMMYTASHLNALVVEAEDLRDPNGLPAQYREQAQVDYHEPGDLEIDSDAPVSVIDGDNPEQVHAETGREEGAWVGAWIWMPNDKEQ